MYWSVFCLPLLAKNRYEIESCHSGLAAMSTLNHLLMGRFEFVMATWNIYLLPCLQLLQALK